MMMMMRRMFALDMVNLIVTIRQKKWTLNNRRCYGATAGTLVWQQYNQIFQKRM